MAIATPQSATCAGKAARHSTLRNRIQRFARRAWRGIRDWCGDSAYEHYLRATKRRHPQDQPLTEKDFYTEQLNRKYSRPSRCC
jgi:uncharacterized short protein YbdD (DUF466 family)